MSHKFNRMTLLQCDWLENVPSSEKFFFKQMDMLIFATWSAGSLFIWRWSATFQLAQGGLTTFTMCLKKWHIFFPRPLLLPSCRLLYLKQTVPAQWLDCTWIWCLLDIYTLAMLDSSLIPAQGLGQQALCSTDAQPWATQILKQLDTVLRSCLCC